MRSLARKRKARARQLLQCARGYRVRLPPNLSLPPERWPHLHRWLPGSTRGPCKHAQLHSDILPTGVFLSFVRLQLPPFRPARHTTRQYHLAQLWHLASSSEQPRTRQPKLLQTPRAGDSKAHCGLGHIPFSPRPSRRIRSWCPHRLIRAHTSWFQNTRGLAFQVKLACTGAENAPLHTVTCLIS